MFELLRGIILDERAAAKELSDEVAKGEKSAAQLKELQSKFGVAQAKLRNIETLHVAPSGYGAVRSRQTPAASTSGVATYDDEVSPSKRRAGGSLGSGGGGDDTVDGPAGGAEAHAIQEARERSEAKLVQLILAEDETVLMVQEVAERLIKQRRVVRECSPSDTDRMLLEAKTEKKLEEEHRMLATQLRELRRVRSDIERKLKVSTRDNCFFLLSSAVMIVVVFDANTAHMTQSKCCFIVHRLHPLRLSEHILKHTIANNNTYNTNTNIKISN